MVSSLKTLIFIFFCSEEVPPIITDIRQSIESGNRVEECAAFSKKATEVGTNSCHKVEGTFEIGSQYHFSMEPQTCVVVPIEDGLDVYSSTQWMDATQIAVAEALGVPNNFINIQVRRLGGGFGGKISRPALIACAAAIAAHLLNRPVRFVMTIEANMNIVGKRYPCFSSYAVDVAENGKIQKLKNNYVEDYGNCFNEPAYLTTGFFDNCYDAKSFDVIANRTRTDTASNTWCRGPGTVEGIAMIENIMEHIAWKVKKDPLEVRMNNIEASSDMKKLLPEFARSVGKSFVVLRFLKINSNFS